MSLNRDITITYLGHATLLITTPGGKRILIDAWTIGNPACPAEWKAVEKLGKLDIILITHMHSDHVGDFAEIIKANPDAEVVGIFEAAQQLARQGAKRVQPMNKGGGINIGDIRIVMTHAFHSSSSEGENGATVYGGEPVGYVVTLENGFTFYAAGDTAVFGDMAMLRDLYHPELAFLPIGDRFTMGPQEAALAVRLLQVKHVIPIHYATFPLLTGTPDALRARLTDLPNVTLHPLAPGDTTVIRGS